jgi:RNA processing factor Prp31
MESFEHIPDYSSPSYDDDYQEALKSDVVSAVRKLVNAIRASGQRREDLDKAINEWNSKLATNRTNSESTEEIDELMRVVTLLRDVDTRWSSTFNMIDRAVELYPVMFFNLYSLLPHSLTNLFTYRPSI